MARCGCNPSCACVIKDGTCIDVKGIGTPSNPYVFNVKVDGTSITCSPNGLNRTIFTVDTNTVDISGAGTAADPLKMDVILTPDANVPDPDGLGTGNLIGSLPAVGTGGIYVSCEDIQDCVGAALSNMLVGDCLIYDDAANAMTLQICPEQNGLECVPVGDAACPAGGLAVFPSSDANNALIIGTDGRLFTPPFTVTAGPCLQPITQAGTPADPYIIAPQVAPELNGLECIVGQGLAVIPSSDPDNALVFGTDNRLYADLCFNVLPSQIRIGEAGACFESTGDGCVTPYTIITRLSDDPCQGMCCRPDGLFVFLNTDDLPAPVGAANENWQAGPFNGTFNDLVLMAPRCVSITNTSGCKTMFVNVLVGGTVDIQKNSGNFVVQFQTSLTGVGGPWTSAVTAAALDPDPPTPQATRGKYTLNGADFQAVELAPGASQQVCFRIVADGFFLANGIINNSDRTASISGEWGDNVGTC